MRSEKTLNISFLRLFENNLLLTVLCMTLAVGYLIFFSVVFEQNDDVIMKLIANGYITGQPESHLVFINSAIGVILKLLYTYLPKIEWYAVMMVALLFLSFLSNLYAILKNEAGIKKITLVVLNLSVIYFLSRLQFSYVSGFLAVSAVLLQYYHFQKKNTQALILSFFLMLLSAMIRLEMFFFTYPLLFLVFVYRFKSSYILGIGIIAVAMAWIFNYQTYHSDSEWEKYYTYNKSRGRVTNNINLDLSSENLRTVGLTEDDGTLIRNYIFSENLSVEKMDLLSIKQRSASLSHALKFIFSYTGAYFVTLILVFFISLLMKNKILAAACIIHFLLCVFTVIFVNSIQYRILYPTLFFIVFFLIKETNRRNASLTFLLLTGVLSLIELRDIKKTQYFSARSLGYVSNIEKFLPYEKTYVVDPTSNPLIINKIAFKNPNRKYLFHGWLTNFPYNKKMSSYSSNPFEMKNFPLIIKEENFINLKSSIHNSEVYIIKNREVVILHKKIE